MTFNLCAFGTDSYKHSHHKFYPKGLETVYSYCEARKGGQFNETVFFGLQYLISRYLTGEIVTLDKIEEANRVCNDHFGNSNVFNYNGWYHILNAHDGNLPIRIKALPEGIVVPEGTPLFTIENTDPEVPWLTNFLETILMQVWSPITVATSSREIKKIIAKYLEKTGDPEGLPFKLHDFGYRGVSSVETAALAGAAHLVNFLGSDTMAAIPLLRDYYAADSSCFSIPATEHSIMTSRGPEGEADLVRQILTEYPTGLVAMVIDSYDTIGFIKDVIGKNQDIIDRILNRQGTVVFRPDSGKLPQIDVDVFYALASVFGTKKNSKGYHVLPSQVRMIQGDGIEWYPQKSDTITGKGYDYSHTIEDILNAFKRERISADNIAFGSGGGLLQKFNRDTQRFAIKCSAMKINGEWQDIYKQPKTDATKNSKRGRLGVFRNGRREIRTLNIHNVHESKLSDNLLQTVFENGKLIKGNKLSDVRERAAL